MAESRIKWRKADAAGRLVTKEEKRALSEAVRGFNRKIDRLAQKDPSIASKLPARASTKALKSIIRTRVDLTREIDSLRRFLEKDAERMVNVPGSRKKMQITSWQFEEMRKRTRIVNIKRKQRLKALEDIEVESRGEKLGYKKSQIAMGSMDKNALLPTKAFTPGMEKADVIKKYRALQKESQVGWFDKKLEEMKANYIEALKQNFVKAERNKMRDIFSTIKKMDPREFYKIYNAQAGETFDDLFAYPPDKSQVDNYIEALRDIWVKQVDPEAEEAEEAEKEKEKKNKKKKNKKKKSARKKAQQ